MHRRKVPYGKHAALHELVAHRLRIFHRYGNNTDSDIQPPAGVLYLADMQNGLPIEFRTDNSLVDIESCQDVQPIILKAFIVQ